MKKHKCPVCEALFNSYKNGLCEHLDEVHPDYDMFVHYPEYMMGFEDSMIVVSKQSEEST